MTAFYDVDSDTSVAGTDASIPVSVGQKTGYVSDEAFDTDMIQRTD